MTDNRDAEEAGAREMGPAAAAAPRLRPGAHGRAVRAMRGPQPEDPAARARMTHLLLGHPWKAASSERYRSLPHQDTLRRQWASPADFVWCVEHIRKVGYEEYFIGRVWTYYDLADADGRTVRQTHSWALPSSRPSSSTARCAARRRRSSRSGASLSTDRTDVKRRPRTIADS